MSQVPGTIDSSHLYEKEFLDKEKMSDLLDRPFYDLGLQRDLDFEITRFDDQHLQITSFPLDAYVPSSEITITTLFVSKELPLPDFFHVTWVINDKVTTQVFGTEAGCFDDKDRYIITCRFEPKTIQLAGLKMKDLFRHTPRITAYSRKNGDELVFHENPKTIKIRFHFRQVMSTFDYLWEGVTTYIPSYLSLVTVLTEQPL